LFASHKNDPKAIDETRGYPESLPAYAQDAYPTKSVTMVVPFPPGGGTDTGARWIAQKLSEKWGQAVVVDN
jgi:tripartite-type tricarboxylate transporter receptor subunit TctC